MKAMRPNNTDMRVELGGDVRGQLWPPYLTNPPTRHLGGSMYLALR